MWAWVIDTIYSFSSDCVGHGHRSLRTATISLVNTEDIIVMMLVEVYLGHKIPVTLPLEIGEHELILKG